MYEVGNPVDVSPVSRQSSNKLCDKRLSRPKWLAVAEQVWLRLAEMIDYKPHLR